jgi:hypothetical protein
LFHPDEFYEVRFYAPYFEGEDGRKFTLNNIKIVPIGAEDDVTKEKPGFGHNSPG